MSISASYVDGKFTSSVSSESLSSATEGGNTVNKDQFLQLLVAQMKYQDPLEPTSNTEWVSQYANFSELETMQGLAANMNLMRASTLVGQTVIMKTTSETTGEESYVTGKVDYVVYENSKAFLSINDSLYSMDDLDTVADPEYIEAYDKASKLVTALEKLPTVANLTLLNAESVESVYGTYSGMSDYEKTFLASSVVELLEAYASKITELKKVSEESETTV